MRMTEVQVGAVYVRGYFRGRHGTRPSQQHVKVDATAVRYDGSTSGRFDRVQVHNVNLNEETGEWEYSGARSSDGNPIRFLLMARELVSLEEAAREKAVRDAREQRRLEIVKTQRDFALGIARLLAMRLGIDHQLVDVSTRRTYQDDSDGLTFEATRAEINGRAISIVMTSDPDVVLIAEILEDIEPDVLMAMSNEELAQHIVGGLRTEVTPGA